MDKLTLVDITTGGVNECIVMVHVAQPHLTRISFLTVECQHNVTIILWSSLLELNLMLS